MSTNGGIFLLGNIFSFILNIVKAQETGRSRPVRIERRPAGGWRLSCRQWLPGRPAEVFPFFGSARNLELITPPFLEFRIRRVRGEPLGAGSLIDYSIALPHTDTRSGREPPGPGHSGIRW